MEKDNFLDTNIIFSYSNYQEKYGKGNSPIIRKCYLYVVNKKSKFLICGAVMDELEEVIKKRARIYKAVIDKMSNSGSEPLENNPLLSFRDIPFAKKLYEKFKTRKPEEIASIFNLERRSSEIIIQQFIEFKVDEKVIPSEQINKELVGKIHDYIDNHADCKILASALQLQKDNGIFLFVTADGKDLNPNNYDFLKKQFEINFSKEGYKFPELVNLMFVD